VLPNEALRGGVVLCCMRCYIGHKLTSTQMCPVLHGFEHGRTAYCSAACFFSQSSKSACE